ncbi:hypothetical protein [Polaribacter sp. Hel1_85]|uniref:hypothetical protein n=1 Tax=Polaribacter sp. Hel1_85 TaxID=1250005 RepID=UPI00052CF223|nr:hypothetical protein [Polaribacter sp. Hel1_85]KGL63325.1 hypothetical protein PHEL85_0359 [Polaribacter sp. Hel1_85]
MKTNKLDNSIKEKLQNRTFEPSASAWERLSTQLDEEPKQKKRGWFFYIGAAASILLLVAIGTQFLSSNKEEITPNVIIVDNPIDTNTIDKKIEQFINEIPVEKVLVKSKKVEEKQRVEREIAKNGIIKKSKSVIPTKEESQKNKNRYKEESNIIVNVDEQQDVYPTKEKSIKLKTYKQDPNSSIKINSDDLLFAVTHSSKEVKEYYAKHDLTRDDILKSIKSELKKSNIKVNPNAILAEVERTIGEEDFQNNFMKSIKRRVSDIATALASRND